MVVTKLLLSNNQVTLANHIGNNNSYLETHSMKQTCKIQN